MTTMQEKHDEKERLIHKIAKRIAKGDESPLEEKEIERMEKDLHRLSITDLQLLADHFNKKKKKSKKKK
ncbi:MAG: hypothetical protein V4436_00075 [Patescibacteria group bacterium]